MYVLLCKHKRKWEADATANTYDRAQAEQRLSYRRKQLEKCGYQCCVVKAPEKQTLAELKLTNGEGGEVSLMSDLLEWMHLEGFKVPATARAMDALLAKYIQYSRREQMAWVSRLRVSRGQTPLPKGLALKHA